MRSFQSFALAIAGLLLAGPAQAADPWLGVWGFPPIPVPASAKPKPVTQPANVPVPPLLIENPGGVSLVDPPADLGDFTMRQLVRVSAAGKSIRLHFSNEDGDEALVIGTVHVAKAGPDGSALPGSDRVVRFDGKPGVTIPSWAPYDSDPVDVDVGALDRLVISIYVPGPARRSGHILYQYASPGDQTGSASLPAQKLMRLPALVTRVDVAPIGAGGSIVALGDSITEGAHSTVNAFRSWPDRLAERLAERHAPWSVVNEGIGGNRLVRHVTGPNALARMDRDVLAVPGVKIVVLMEGINDIGRTFTPEAEQEPSTLEQLESVVRQIVGRAHDRGLIVWGATLTPYEGAHYYAQAGGQMRAAFNDWIRNGHVFDQVLDFDQALRDPAHPSQMDARFDSGDHLHPNDAGYAAMAAAIPLPP
ncbi:MAG TPA: SGNH/GDSL hydrolase family protein [Rhizomicrobium sp.]|nr:SGNH/GDSL hydrolase family protein [Rhizomicrobium sp.]